MLEEHQLPAEDEPRPAETKARRAARLGRYRDMLARRWWILSAGLALGILIGGVLWWHRPRLFISSGRMIVSIKLAIPEGSVYSEELGNFLGTQAALMKSGVVLNRAQARLLEKGTEPGIEPFALKVAVYPKTSIFVLEATGPDAARVQSFCQGCMEEYIRLKKEMRTQTSDSTVAGLTEEVVRLERDLRACEDELARFEKTNSVVLLQEQGNGMAGYVATLNQRIAALKTEDAFLRSLSPGEPLAPRQAAAVTPDGLPPAATADQEPDVARARQHIQVLKAQLQDLGRYLRPKHPKMVALTEEIAQRETLLGILLDQNSAELESRKGALSRQLGYLEETLAEWNARAIDCSQKMAEYQRLKANQQRVQALYDRLIATLQTLDLNKEINPESVTILEPASPAVPEQHESVSHFMLAGLTGLAFSIVLLLFLDHIDDRIKSFTELQDWFKEPILAQVPLEHSQKKGAEIGLLDENDSRHAFVEACRSLRSSLLFRTPALQPARTLLLTSSVPGEGKSLISSNLAITMARAHARVLLIDADLRKGGLAERFGLTPGLGFSEVLREGSAWQKAVQPTACPGLFVIPRGTPTSRSGELFLSHATHQLLREAAAAYDCVILDAAPVMAADDVTSLAPRVDGVLFVLRAERTSARVARAALELLYRRRVNVLGIVFNAVRPTNADYYTYSRYDHYCNIEAGRTLASLESTLAPVAQRNHGRP